MVLERYTALEVISIGSEVQTSRGTLPRDAVRLSHAHTRPGGIGPQERWVHVDLFEQVLTAYEGDHLVFATLVSTGKRGWETPIGIFRIWLKLRHGAMRGRRAAYLVEEVPHSLFFGEETALHGANWHDRFGTAVSHGCINLSPADAAWLFRWAPPELPEGWHGILPGPAGLQALWVHIERGDARQATAARATARSARNALTAECSRADGECRNPSRDCGVATAE
ncbi:MAG: L,D-transpeptidase [Myxococcaceae bacterium]